MKILIFRQKCRCQKVAENRRYVGKTNNGHTLLSRNMSRPSAELGSRGTYRGNKRPGWVAGMGRRFLALLM
jgi:hypothetical protein